MADQPDQEQPCNTTASGQCATAEGCNTVAAGACSHAEGDTSAATGRASHAEGETTVAAGEGSHAEGSMSVARQFAHAEGISTLALGLGSHAEGNASTAGPANYAHAEGTGTLASGPAAHAEGNTATASGEGSHAEGTLTLASGAFSHAEGQGVSGTLNLASGTGAHVEGNRTTATNSYAHAEGQLTTAGGFAAHAEGTSSTATATAAHAEGSSTSATGSAAHAEGSGSAARGTVSHAEGASTTASGYAAHAEGESTTSSSEAAHAEGYITTASAFTSHAEGYGTTASGSYSHAEGLFTSTNGHPGAHIMGRYGAATDDYSWFVANGTSSSALSLAAKLIGATGDLFIAGMYGTLSADYAELFETADGNSIEPGYFVTLAGRKIRPVSSRGDHVLGITSGAPGFVGNTAALHWHARFMTDEWGRPLYDTVVIPAVKDPEGRVIEPERTETRPRLNPAWDPSRPYVSRLDRPEWVAVGLVGQLKVRDDGTCAADGYCVPNAEGVATAAPAGYRVMDRLGPHQILILFQGGLAPAASSPAEVPPRGTASGPVIGRPGH